MLYPPKRSGKSIICAANLMRKIKTMKNCKVCMSKYSYNELMRQFTPEVVQHELKVRNITIEFISPIGRRLNDS